MGPRLRPCQACSEPGFWRSRRTAWRLCLLCLFVTSTLRGARSCTLHAACLPACLLACPRLITSVRGEDLEMPTWSSHFFTRWLHGVATQLTHAPTTPCCVDGGHWHSLYDSLYSLYGPPALTALFAAWLAVMLPHGAFGTCTARLPHACMHAARQSWLCHAHAAWGACHCMCASVWELGACAAFPCFNQQSNGGR